MRVGVNGDLRADFSGPKQMEIVQVKTVGLSVELDGHVMFFCRMEIYSRSIANGSRSFIRRPRKSQNI